MKNILLAIVIVCPLACLAQDIKPFDAKTGLWESTAVTEMSGLPAMPAMPALSEEQLAKIPPAQRAQVEAAMKGRGSMGSPRTTTTKSCLTREMLNKPLFNNGDKSCTTKLVNATSNTQQIHVECSSDKTKTSGDMTLERADAEHFKGTMLMKSSGGDAGRSIDIKMTINSKWLASDCGDVKPVGDK